MLSPWPFVIGTRYHRRDHIHARYGGQRYGGIATPAKHPLVICFTGEDGKAHEYHDAVDEDGVWRFFGEGQTGDMTMDGGNRAIRDHITNHKDLLLFQKEADNWYRFLGAFVCIGHSENRETGRLRYVFHLQPLEAMAPSPGEDLDAQLVGLSLAELRQRALAAPPTGDEPRLRKVAVRLRSAAVRLYALHAAGGSCGLCLQPAPFTTLSGEPFLEVHHLDRLADGGPDHPDHVIALCPNCHRRAHHGHDADDVGTRLRSKIASTRE